MKKIRNLTELKYRKLYLRSEIAIKEIEIRKKFSDLRDDVRTVDVKNEVLQSALNNPSVIINTARITFDIIRFLKRRRQKKNQNK